MRTVIFLLGLTVIWLFTAHLWMRNPEWEWPALVIGWCITFVWTGLLD